MTEDSMVVSFEKTRQRLSGSCDGPTKLSKPRRLDAMDYARDVPAGLINACQYSLMRSMRRLSALLRPKTNAAAGPALRASTKGQRGRAAGLKRYDQRPTRRRGRQQGMRPKVNAASGRMGTRAAKVGADTYHGMRAAPPRSRSH